MDGTTSLLFGLDEFWSSSTSYMSPTGCYWGLKPLVDKGSAPNVGGHVRG